MFVILCDIIDEFKMWFLWQITKRDSNSDGGKKNCLCTTCKSNPTKSLYHTKYVIVKKIFQNHKNFCLFPKNKYNCFNNLSIEIVPKA